MKTLKEALINLLKVKSLFSLVAMAMFIFLIVTEKITGEVAMATITAIVTYYFAKKEDVEPEKITQNTNQLTTNEESTERGDL